MLVARSVGLFHILLMTFIKVLECILMRATGFWIAPIYLIYMMGCTKLFIHILPDIQTKQNVLIGYGGMISLGILYNFVSVWEDWNSPTFTTDIILYGIPFFYIPLFLLANVATKGHLDREYTAKIRISRWFLIFVFFMITLRPLYLHSSDYSRFMIISTGIVHSFGLSCDFYLIWHERFFTVKPVVNGEWMIKYGKNQRRPWKRYTQAARMRLDLN
uniref:Acyl_transf_3 domain-containing protein n=1 Tax=Caenorhabditis tropicalis TaxID=1561998 RepID=A0A1I7UCH0_9PELO